MLISTVLQYNTDTIFLGKIDWRSAMTKISKGTAIAVETSDRIIHSTEDTVTYLPTKIQLIKKARIKHKSKVRYSRENVHIRDRYTCQYCGDKLTRRECTADHVIPKSRKGKPTFMNMVTSCGPCNNKKADRTPSEANMTLIRQPYRPTIMEFIIIRDSLLPISERMYG